MKLVYIVFYGEDNESGHVASCFENLKDAQSFIKKRIEDFKMYYHDIEQDGTATKFTDERGNRYKYYWTCYDLN